MQKMIHQERHYPPSYFSNWVDNFMPPLANNLLPFVSKLKFITPNRLTVTSFLLYVIASFLLLLNFQFKPYLISFLFFLSYLLDCLDGQLARKEKKTSLLGKFLDFNLDYFKVYFLFLFLSLSVFNETKDLISIILGLSAACFFGFRYYIKYTLMFIMMGDDKNYLIESQKRREFLYKKISEERKQNKNLLQKIINFFKVNSHILRVDEGELIFFTIIGLLINNLKLILYFFFLIQLCWIVFRLISRSFHLVYNKKKLFEPLLK